jgi:hypothetical protein
MIVRAEKIQRRIHQACFLNSEKDRISSIVRSEPARTQPFVRFAAFFFLIGKSDFETTSPATLKDTQNISRLRNFPSRKRI